MVTYSVEVRKLATHILNKFFQLKLSRMRSVDATDFKPNVKWIFNELNCSEEDFVLALDYIRNKHSKHYHQIDVPSRWDGCAHLEFPHLFIEEDEVELEAIIRIGKFFGSHGDYVQDKNPGDRFILPKEVASFLIRKGMAKVVNFER